MSDCNIELPRQRTGLVPYSTNRNYPQPGRYESAIHFQDGEKYWQIDTSSDIVAAALGEVVLAQPIDRTGLTPRQQRKIDKVVDYLSSNIADDLPAIALFIEKDQAPANQSRGMLLFKRGHLAEDLSKS